MKFLIILAAVVACVAGKPFSDWWRSKVPSDGQFVLTQDSSLEHGVRDYSLEFVRPYKPGSTPLFKKGAGGGHHWFSLSSEEEQLYLANQLNLQGFPLNDRVKALSDTLGTPVLELTDEDMFHHFHPQSPTKYPGGQYFINASGELFFRPGNQATQHATGAQHATGGSGVTVAKK